MIRLLLGRKPMTNLESILKSRDITLLTKIHLVKAVIFLVVMYGWELDHKESWMPKNWCFWTMVLQNTLLRVPWIARRSNQSILGEINPEYSLEAEAPILWLPDAKNRLIRKDPDAGKDWRQEEKGTAEDEMVGLHHWFDGHEFEQAPGVGWTGKPGMLKSMGSQRVRHDWATELNWES